VGGKEGGREKGWETVLVCGRERERGGEGDKERERERGGEREKGREGGRDGDRLGVEQLESVASCIYTSIYTYKHVVHTFISSCTYIYHPHIYMYIRVYIHLYVFRREGDRLGVEEFERVARSERRHAIRMCTSIYTYTYVYILSPVYTHVYIRLN
jgi:hypothetical protein